MFLNKKSSYYVNTVKHVRLEFINGKVFTRKLKPKYKKQANEKKFYSFHISNYEL